MNQVIYKGFLIISCLFLSLPVTVLAGGGSGTGDGGLAISSPDFPPGLDDFHKLLLVFDKGVAPNFASMALYSGVSVFPTAEGMQEGPGDTLAIDAISKNMGALSPTQPEIRLVAIGYAKQISDVKAFLESNCLDRCYQSYTIGKIENGSLTATLNTYTAQMVNSGYTRVVSIRSYRGDLIVVERPRSDGRCAGNPDGSPVDGVCRVDYYFQKTDWQPN